MSDEAEFEPDSDDDLRPQVLAELRRARRHLLVAATGATDEQMERPSRRIGGCMKWHLGHAAFLERAHLGRLVGPLADDWHGGVLGFGPQSMDEREGGLPLAKELLRWLAASRKLTEAVAAAVVLDERNLSVFRDMVDADHGQARYVRARRAEVGLPPVNEPRSALLELDTECDVPPRWHLPAWTPRRAPVPASRGGAVVSLEDLRHARGRRAMERGHAAVGEGDLRAALQAFQESARWEETADAVTYQAWMHSLLGDLDTAEQLCLRAIRLDPAFGNPYNDIGTICLKRRDLRSAIEWFERAKRAPRYEPRHFPFVNLGRVYMTLGMPKEALAEFEGALALSPASEDIRALVENVREQLRQG